MTLKICPLCAKEQKLNKEDRIKIASDIKEGIVYICPRCNVQFCFSDKGRVSYEIR